MVSFRYCAVLVAVTIALAGCKDSPEVVICGDGVRAGDEECDCGRDFLYRPGSCTDINGAPGANCDSSCVRIAVCGDGRVDGAEECDDGNLVTGDGCNAQCLSEGMCTPAYLDDCRLEPIPQSCCEDAYGEQLVCHGLSGYEFGDCLRECGSTADCYWDTMCEAELGDACIPAYCGPNTWLGGQSNALCAVPGGGPGWCWPILHRELPERQQQGYCVEAGTIPPGGACAEHWPKARSENTCDMGICLAGACLAFCEWEDAYDTAMYDATPLSVLGPCPYGTNCVGETTIHPDTGLLEDDFGLCRALVGPNDLIACSLVTSQLLSDPTRRCADLEYTGYTRCEMINFTSGIVVNGALLGTCVEGAAANRAVWEGCNPATDLCPSGSECVEQDLFAASPQGPTVCVPYCDTRHPAGRQTPCADQGAVPTADGTPVCTSRSQLHNPDDAYPTRLGFCALPPP